MPDFFEDYWPYRQFIDAGQYPAAVEGALHLMESVKQLAPAEFDVAHKGTPFYVLGFAAFVSHDYSAASLFFDAAVEEDLNNHPGRNDTAALSFMQLVDNGVPTLARPFVIQIADDIKVLIADYNARQILDPKGHPTSNTQPITFNELRTLFLNRSFNLRSGMIAHWSRRWFHLWANGSTGVD
jgi:hypothetical protein